MTTVIVKQPLALPRYANYPILLTMYSYTIHVWLFAAGISSSLWCIYIFSIFSHITLNYSLKSEVRCSDRLSVQCTVCSVTVLHARIGKASNPQNY